MNERIKALRKRLGLTQQAFADRLKIARGNIGAYEVGKNAPSDAVISLICKEFDVSENWLRTGEGEMFVKLSEDEEIASLVSDVLEDGKNNPFYGIILDIMRTYNELSPASQEVMKEFSEKLVANMKKED